MASSVEDRLAKIEKTAERLQAMVDGLTKKQTLGSPLGVFDPSGSIDATHTAYALIVLALVNSTLTLNFDNITTPVSLSGKTLQGGVPIQLAGVTYWMGVYQ